MAIVNEHFLFRSYSVAVKKFLIENCYLSRYPKDKNILVSYMTPPRAFVKYVIPIINGAPAQPIISFHLSGYERQGTQSHLGFVKENIYDSETDIVKTVSAPMIHKLTYSLIIYTRLQSDMDVVLYQILIAADPNKKGVDIVDGQWMEIGATDPRDETTLEPGDAQDKLIRFGLDLYVPRAYLPRAYEEYEAIKLISEPSYDPDWDGDSV